MGAKALFIGFLLLMAYGGKPLAQTPPSSQLEIGRYAGILITGDTDKVYSIEYIPDLSQTNNESAWRCLEFFRAPRTNSLWLDSSAPINGKRFYRARPFAPPTNMVFIPPGTFRMGSGTNETDRYAGEGQMDVIISRGFWMKKYEVTQREFLDVMGTNTSFFNGVKTNIFTGQVVDSGLDLNRPAESMNWDQANEYCRKITERERIAGIIPIGSEYRMPTEAQWEYACRAWTSTRFSYGDDAEYKQLGAFAWYKGNFTGTTQPVGKKFPNPWGLYDMHGNVWEMCYDQALSRSPGVFLDPAGTTNSNSSIVVRGGGAGTEARACRSAVTALWSRADTGDGFRVVLIARGE